jgi:hypothetical protein
MLISDSLSGNALTDGLATVTVEPDALWPWLHDGSPSTGSSKEYSHGQRAFGETRISSRSAAQQEC